MANFFSHLVLPLNLEVLTTKIEETSHYSHALTRQNIDMIYQEKICTFVEVRLINTLTFGSLSPKLQMAPACQTLYEQLYIKCHS